MPPPACKELQQPSATEVLRGQRYKYSPNHPHPQAFLMHFSSTIHIFSSTRAGNKEKSRGLFAPRQKCSGQTGGDYRVKKCSALHQPSERAASPYAARCASHRTAVRFVREKRCQQEKAHILHLPKRGRMEKTPLYI